MSKDQLRGFDPRVIAMVIQSGLPYEVKRGSKHVKLYIDGRLALCVNGTKPRDVGRLVLNGITNVRHTIAKIKADKKETKQ
jgi:hypothetical protein